MAAPVVASVGTPYEWASGTSLVPAVPSGVVAGSLVVVFLYADWSAATTTPAAGTLIVPPTGFILGTEINRNGGAADFSQLVCWYYKYATAADSGTYSFSVNSLDGHAIGEGNAIAARITGGTGSGSPFTDTVQSFAPAKSTSTTISSFTPDADNSLLLAGMIYESGGTFTYPTGWTKDAGGVTGSTGAIGHVAQTTAAATGSLTFSTTAGLDIMCILIMTLRGIPAQAEGSFNSSAMTAMMMGGGM